MAQTPAAARARRGFGVLPEPTQTDPDYGGRDAGANIGEADGPKGEPLDAASQSAFRSCTKPIPDRAGARPE